MKMCWKIPMLLAAWCLAGGCDQDVGKAERPDPDEVARKWYAAIASGDARSAGNFVSGAESDSAALMRELAEIKTESAKRKTAFDVGFAAFTPAKHDRDRATLTIVADDGRRIVLVLRRIADEWKITRISTFSPRQPETPVEVARKWHNAIMNGDSKTANALSFGAKQKKENLDAIAAVKKLSADSSKLEVLKNATFSETGHRATVLVYTGGNFSKLMLENIDGSWKIVGTE